MTPRANHLYSNGPDIQRAFGVDSLPLTIVAHIISYLEDDIASLARLCRTSRVLLYMTLPHLWKNVRLKSYRTIRYKDDLPEGFGGASPFAMGLNTLLNRNVSRLVHSLSLEGEFGVGDVDEYAKAGRVPEGAMILNIAIRAALEQCTQLRSLRWDLNVRRQPNVYASLATLPMLESLWLRFPNNRSPQPLVEAPALPNLKSLTITHYDPLCSPDDLANLFFHATNLNTLNLHFSPRMREQGETSVMITQFFRKNIAAKRKLRLRKIGLYNLLPYIDMPECLEALDPTVCEDFTALNTFGMDEDQLGGRHHATHFIDRAWMVPLEANSRPKNPKSLRLDQLHKRHALDLGASAGLERLYLINARYRSEGADGAVHSTPNSTGTSPRHPNNTSSVTQTARNTPSPSTNLRDLYIDNICNVCGPTLKHLILPARWLLPTAVTARLIRACPNLTQLSAAIQCADYDVLRILVPFLSKLWAIRVLAPYGDVECPEDRDRVGTTQKQQPWRNAAIDLTDCGQQERITQVLGRSLGGAENDFPKLRYIGLGNNVFKVGGVVEEVVRLPAHTTLQDWYGDCDGTQRAVEGDDGTNGTTANGWREEVVRTRLVERVTEEEVKDVEIWKMDSMDVI
ncbi:hypothetical protein HRR83_009343 [Exophiala dermatitidis]|uniref:F-box domain-containing protein n=1 Tax=Exophiala dermatitidis TaxID=5970 RepID=A0AAN6IQH9_EXODE|nr:hypothetical protein HRR75_007478 [Exophiala dermatitidis]KAJ4507224.1 hypothetical protein HRR74_008147 [Exophiala dermatitidis]KAJ4517301.1 hypothetical protein HRR73_004353 [Exophiala dermatitidis]KAJ4550725.1 hypothetical protein HRR78_004494 [Exophiala dermatitidis]KAJ4552326.1 hypothetical protein HRR77_002343 [Exophiala dermatitidis]